MIKTLPQSLIDTAKKILTESVEHPMIDVDGEMRHRHNSNGKPIHHTDEGIRNFHRWFGNSTTVDTHGRPKVFYHGTQATGENGNALDRFNPYYNLKSKQLYGAGIYLTEDPSIASSYATSASREHVKDASPNVIPVYVKSQRPLDIDKPIANSVIHLSKKSNIKQPSGKVKQYIDEYANGGNMPKLNYISRAYENDTGRYSDFDKHEDYARNKTIDAIHSKIKSGEIKTGKDLFDIHAKSYYHGLNETGIHNAATESLGKLGFDSIKHIGGRNVGWQDHPVVIAFHPNQIKSALGNTGNFHPDSPQINESADEPRLHHVAEVKTNFPGADYYVVRKGTPDAVGKVTNEFSPEHIGVKITRTDILHPKYHQYSMQYAHMNGYWKEKAKGALRLQHISVDDVKNMPVVYRGLNESAEYAPSTHHFDPDQIEKSRYVGYKSRTKLINMPIDDFLSVAQHTEGVGDKMDGVKSLINSGTKFSSIPQLYVDATDNNDAHKVYGHEGRHRALALKQRGYTHIPVHIIHSSIRWSEQSNPARFDYKEHWPTKLIGEDNRHTIEFPVKREDSEKSFSE